MVWELNIYLGHRAVQVRRKSGHDKSFIKCEEKKKKKKKRQ